MVSSRGNLFITIIGLAVLLPCIRGGCRDQLMQDQNAMTCFMKIGTYMTEAGTGGPNISSPDGMIQLICSPKGKEAFGCALSYMKKCPELLTAAGAGGNPMLILGEIPGFDVQTLLNEGLDGVCSIMTGACSEVTKCFAGPQGGSTGGVVKREAPATNNFYLLFQVLTGSACGTMKDQMTCLLKVLEKCPKSVKERTEKEFENAFKLSMSSPYGSLSFEDIKRFITSECPKMPKDFSDNTCAKDVFVSKEFVTCNEAAAKQYSEARTCDVYEKSKECVSEIVKPKCGMELAVFLVRNTNVIFPGIPDDCDDPKSGNDVIHSSFGLLLISSMFVMFHVL